MRILQVVKRLQPGGAENVVLSLAESARAGGHEVAVAAAHGAWSERFRVQHYPIPPSSADLRAMVAGASALRAAIRAFRPEVVHAHNPGVIAMTSLATGRGTTVPVVGTSHGGVSPRTLARHAVLFKMCGMPIISCGPGVTAGLEGTGFKVYRTIENGVQPASTKRDFIALRGSLGLEATQPVAVVVGRLTRAKNQEQVLRALVEVPVLTVLICGDGPELARLQNLAKEIGVADRTRFLGLRADARLLMQAADIVVLSSRYEGLPLVLVEAMSEGTPVIATDVIGSRELVSHSENGLLVPVDDPHALAGAMGRVLEDKALARTLATQGVRTAALYTRERMVQRHLELYKELVAARRP